MPLAFPFSRFKRGIFVFRIDKLHPIMIKSFAYIIKLRFEFILVYQKKEEERIVHRWSLTNSCILFTMDNRYRDLSSRYSNKMWINI